MMLDKTCLECKVIFKSHHSRVGKYCSKSCASKARIHPKFRVELECTICNKLYLVKRYRQNISKTCSRKCLAIFRGKIHSGENHSNWKGGNSKRDHASRKLIAELKKERGCCEKCGAKENLHGHHKEEWSKSKELRYISENIMILCGDCHALEHPKLAGMLTAIKKKSGVYLECEECDNLYYVPKHKEYNSFTCSEFCAMNRLHKIAAIKRKTGININCDVCDKEFYVAKNLIGKRKTCSIGCAGKLTSLRMQGNQYAIGVI